MPKVLYCPYVLTDCKSKRGDLQLNCECGSLRFADKTEYNLFIDRYCGSIEGWKQCTLAKTLNEFYERTDSQ